MNAKPLEDIDLASIAEHIGSEEKARAFFEKLRWPDGIPVCPHCGQKGATRIVRKKDGSKTRKGLWRCADIEDCGQQFTCTVHTIFEDSHIPLNKWLIAIYLMCSSKKGISACQLQRSLKLSYKSAWYLGHRVRYAMTQEPLKWKLTGTVEIDETYVGGRADRQRVKKRIAKQAVVSLVERGGNARSFHVDRVTAKNLKAILKQNVRRDSRVISDSYSGYKTVKNLFPGHDSVNHAAGEYARGDVSTNSVESFFAVLKRGVIGTFHHVSRQHLHRYLSEFDFRYNLRNASDGTRAIAAIGGVQNKRLTYRETIPNEGVIMRHDAQEEGDDLLETD